MNLKTILIFMFGLCVGSLGTYYIIGNDVHFGFVTQSADTDVDIDTDDEDDSTAAKVAQTSVPSLAIQGPTFIPCPGSKDILASDSEVKSRSNLSRLFIKQKNNDREEFDFRPLFRPVPTDRAINNVVAKQIPNKDNSDKDKYLCIYGGQKLQLNTQKQKGLSCSAINEAKRIGFMCAYKQNVKPIIDPQNR